ncbi:hypothetical protein HK098_003468 [Nowakowskiella sp. JEL0407]|nr:hypothetical protein HK098_003468 [Nowakowskiella sp. JEL0407]
MSEGILSDKCLECSPSPIESKQDIPTILAILNFTNQEISYVRIHNNEQQEESGTVNANSSFDLNTFAGHEFIAKTPHGTTISRHVADPESSIWIISNSESLDEINSESSNSANALDRSVQITVSNFSDISVSFFWINYYDQKKEMHYGTLAPNSSVEQQTYVGHEWVARDLEANVLSHYTVTAEHPDWIITIEEDEETSVVVAEEKDIESTSVEAKGKEVTPALPPDVYETEESKETEKLPEYSDEGSSKFKLPEKSGTEIAVNEFQYQRTLLKSAILSVVNNLFSEAVKNAREEIDVKRAMFSSVVESTVNSFKNQASAAASSSSSAAQQITEIPAEKLKWIVDEALLRSAEITHQVSVELSEASNRISQQAQTILRELANDAAFISSVTQNAASTGATEAKAALKSVQTQLSEAKDNVVAAASELPREIARIGSKLAEASQTSHVTDPFSDVPIEINGVDESKPDDQCAKETAEETNEEIFMIPVEEDDEPEETQPKLETETSESFEPAFENDEKVNLQIEESENVVSSPTPASEEMMMSVDDIPSIADSYDFASVQESLDDIEIVSDAVKEDAESEVAAAESDRSVTIDEVTPDDEANVKEEKPDSPPPLPPRLYEEEEEEKFLMGASSMLESSLIQSDLW